MADRYWVGGTANWDATAGTKWATTSGGAGGAAVPTAADDVYFDAASGAVTVTITGADSVCRSADCTGFTGTIAHTIGRSWNIGTTTPGPGNVALKFVSGMTYSPAHGTSTIAFVSTSATQQTIDFAGKTTSAVSFTTAGNWQYTGSHYQNEGLGGAVTISRGTVDFNGQTLSLTGFVLTGSNARTVTFGAATVGLKGAAAWICTTATNLTLSAASATFTVTAAAAVFSHVGADTFGPMVLSGGGGPTITAANATFASITRTGTAVKTNTFVLGSDITVSGAFTVDGNSAVNRVLVASNTVGTARTITAATVSSSHSDWRDITGAGAGSWDLSAITGLSGDCGGNSGITFTTAETQTATGTASFTWSTHGWTSRVPLPQDDVSIPNSFVAGRTITADMPRLGKSIDFTGCTGTPALNFSVSAPEIYGSLTMVPIGTITAGSTGITMLPRSAATITSAGNTFAGLFVIGGTGSTSLNDDFACSSTLNTAGTASSSFSTNNHNLTILSYSASAITPVIDFGTSTVTCTLTTASYAWLLGHPDCAVTSVNCDLVISTASSVTRSIRNGRYSNVNSRGFRSVTYTVANSPGTLLHTVDGGGSGSGWIGTLNIGSGRTFTINSGGTVYVDNLNVDGVPLVDGITSVSDSGSVTAPDSPALIPSNELEIVCRASNSDWTPSVSRYMVSRQGNSVNNGNFGLIITNSPVGRVMLYLSTGSSATTPTATANAPFVDGVTYWIKATWRGSDGRIQFFYAADQDTEPVSWTQIGTDVTGLVGTLNATPTSLLNIGGNSTIPRQWGGKIYRTIIRRTIGGAADFDVDFLNRPFGSSTMVESSSNAATVTFAGTEALCSDGAIRITASTPGSAATISKTSGTVSGRYLTIKDSTATGGATFNAVDSVDLGNNTGWNFLTANSGNFLELF